MTDVERPASIVIRRRVSLAGRVIPADAGMPAGGTVCLSRTEGPGAPKPDDAKPDNTKPVATKPDNAMPWHRETAVRPDGYYFFLDLPDGDYAVGGRDDRGRLFDVRPAAVPPAYLPARESRRMPQPPPLLNVDLTVLPPLEGAPK